MKPIVLAQIGFIALAAVAVHGFVRASERDVRRARCTALCALTPTYAGQNRSVPAFTLPDFNGKPTPFETFRGKPVLLNFWSKTCAPCLEELPSLARLADEAKTTGKFHVVTICTDEGPAAVADLIEAALGRPAPFPILFDPELAVVRDTFGTTLYPETWAIDSSGIVRARFDGKRDWSTALAHRLFDSIDGPLSCPIEFTRGAAVGEFTSLCGE